MMTEGISSIGERGCLKGTVLRVKFGYNPNSSSYPGSPSSFLFFIFYIVWMIVMAVVGYCIACVLYWRYERRTRKQEENK